MDRINMDEHCGRLSFYDYIITILSFFFLAHEGSSFCAFYTPPVIWAGISLSLFVLLFFFCVKGHEIFSFLLPFVSLELAKTLFMHFSDFGRSDLLYELTGLFQTCVYPLLSYYLLKCNNKNQIVLIFVCFIIVQITTGISTFMAYKVGGENFVRMDIGGLKEESESTYELRMRLNVGTFYTTYGFSMMLPLAIMLFKWRKNCRRVIRVTFVSIACIILFVSVVYVSQYTISFMVSSLACLLLLVPKNISKQFINKSIGVLVVILLTAKFLFPPVLHDLADLVSDSSTMYERIEDIANYLETGTDNSSQGSDFTERSNTYKASIDAIFEYPIIGSWNYLHQGGHSFILDNLAMMGVLGLVLIILYYKVIILYSIKPYIREGWIGYYIYGIMILTVFLFLNPSGLFPYTSFVYPISAYLASNYLECN